MSRKKQRGNRPSEPRYDKTVRTEVDRVIPNKRAPRLNIVRDPNLRLPTEEPVPDAHCFVVLSVVEGEMLLEKIFFALARKGKPMERTALLIRLGVLTHLSLLDQKGSSEGPVYSVTTYGKYKLQSLQ